MDIETLTKIKKSASTALLGRKKLDKMHNDYLAVMKNGSLTRRKTTTYNARAADIMENIISPNEKLIKKLCNC